MVSFLSFAARLEPDVMTPIKTEGKLQPSPAEEKGRGGKCALCGMDGWTIYSGAEFPSSGLLGQTAFVIAS